MEESINILKPSVCFEVQKVIGISTSDGRYRSYQVQWAPSWISGMHLIGCEDLIKQFEDEQGNKELDIKIEMVDTCDLQDGKRFEEKVSNEIIQDVNLPDLLTEQLIKDAHEDVPINTESIESRLYQINCPYSTDNNNGTSVSDTLLDSSIPCPERNDESTDNARKSQGENTVLSFQSNILVNEEKDTHHEGGSDSVAATFLVHHTADRGHSKDCQLSTVPSMVHTKRAIMHTNRVSCEKKTKENEVTINEDNNKLPKKSKCEKMFKCNICKETFGSNEGLSNHFKLHTAYRCAICDISFTSQLYLERHEVVHEPINSERAFCKEKLADCFKQPDYSKIHATYQYNSSQIQKDLQTHTTKKHRFQCHFCGKISNSSSNLRKHVRVHTGERPYECEVCHKKFIQNHHLKRHLEQHSRV